MKAAPNGVTMMQVIFAFFALQTFTPDASLGLPFQPSFDAQTIVWNSYQRGRERIFANTFRNGQLQRNFRQVSPGEGVYYSPLVAGDWIFWLALKGDAWSLDGRNGIGPVTTLWRQALAPAVARQDNRILLAWEDHSTKEQPIRYSLWDGRNWSAPQAVAKHGYRPAPLLLPDGSAWIFYDAYIDGRYAVFVAQVLPSAIMPVRISPAGFDATKATPNFHAKTGLAVAWLATRPVRSGTDVMDHWDTVQLGQLRNGSWTVHDGVADLRHGLLPQIEPAPSNMRGYAGRRRHPMLASAADGLFVLWERKAIHDGDSGTTGQLCARGFDGTRFTDPMVIHEGLVDYRVSPDGSLATAKNIRHDYSIFPIEPGKGRTIRYAEFPGRSVVTPPMEKRVARPSITLHGKTYKLYWADLHVHTELTPDAEGEVDEMIHYARDRALIDVVVHSENDSNSWMNAHPQGAFRNHNLTEAEYRMGIYLARRYSENGRFLALPGWEWSARTDDNRPNHRTVIFAGENTPIVRHAENGNNFAELCDIVEASGGLMLTQHEAYRLVNRPCDANIEVASGWSVFFNNPAKIHADLAQGYKVGFVATGDNHRRVPGHNGGLTGIWAEELTAAAIVEALRMRRIYATTGSRPVMDSRANGVFMGGDVETKDTIELMLAVNASRAVLIRDGEPIHTASSFPARFTDTPPPGFHYYYWRVELGDPVPDYPGNMKVAHGHLAYSSPHRVSKQ